MNETKRLYYVISYLPEIASWILEASAWLSSEELPSFINEMKFKSNVLLSTNLPHRYIARADAEVMGVITFHNGETDD